MHACTSIDDALAFIEAGNQCIAAMERKAAPKIAAVATGRARGRKAA